MKQIIVASTNPVKINATLQGFKRMFPDQQFEVVGVSAPSEVSDQPSTDAETFQGAFNRAKNVSKLQDGDYWVGIEGGIEEKQTEMEAFAWVVIKSKEGYIGKGRTGTFFLPQRIVELIHQGKELGEADDIVFNDTNSKQKHGTIGNLTGSVIDRTTYYIDAVIFALIPFKNPELFTKSYE